MRSAIILIVLVSVACGCNSDPRCRRETALLRAEIVDLEDQYYVLKSKHEQTIEHLGLYDGSTMGEEYVVKVIDEIVIDDQPNHLGIQWNQADQSINHTPLEYSEYSENLDSDDLLRPVSTTKRTARQERVTEIVILPKHSSGKDVDGLPGDEGLNLLIQPRSATGKPLLQPGELIVSVVDPQEKSERQRIGLWKFMPEETELFFVRRGTLPTGILLQLPWDQNLPRNKKLVVFVRYLTPDGRKLESSMDITITPPRSDYSSDEPLVAEWIRSGTALPASGTQARLPVIPVSSHSEKPNKPNWRPVR